MNGINLLITSQDQVSVLDPKRVPWQAKGSDTKITKELAEYIRNVAAII